MLDVYLLLTVAVVLGVIVLALLLFALRRLRQRRAQLLNELGAGAPYGEDRAFNRIEMARRELGIMARQGSDVSRPRELLGQADAAYKSRQYPRAYELAQQSHDALVQLRKGGSFSPTPAAVPAGTPPRAPTPTSAAFPSSTTPTAASSPIPAPAPPLARNRVESQFQLHLFDSELASAQSAHPGTPATVAAAELRTQAQGAFDAGHYTDALRLALKGRRSLGGKVETLAPTPGIAPTSVGSNGDAVDPAAAAEQAAGGSRCPHCGYPTSASDVFCRGCGAPRAPTACPRCGAPRNPSDTFCGRCGERFS